MAGFAVVARRISWPSAYPIRAARPDWLDEADPVAAERESLDRRERDALLDWRVRRVLAMVILLSLMGAGEGEGKL